MRISDWSSDVCSSDLVAFARLQLRQVLGLHHRLDEVQVDAMHEHPARYETLEERERVRIRQHDLVPRRVRHRPFQRNAVFLQVCQDLALRSEEHTSELQSLMRNSYAVFCSTTNKIKKTIIVINQNMT